MAIHTDVKTPEIIGGRYLTRRIAVAMAMEVDGATEELIPLGHRIVANDQKNLLPRLIPNPLFVDRRQDLINEAIFKQTHGAVMVTGHQADAAIEATANRPHTLRATAPVQVTHMDHLIARLDTRIPALNHYCVHLIRIDKWTAGVLYDISMPKMMVAGKPSIEVTILRHGTKMIALSVGVIVQPNSIEIATNRQGIW